MELDGLTHIAFDADDTLWGHEYIFVDAKARCLELLNPFMTPGMDLEQELYRFERENLKIFGYGVKGFVLSMIETALELSNQQISGADIQKIINLGKEMLVHPINLLPYVREAVMTLEDHFSVMVITKGDLFDQENKLARSGLAERFPVVEIVSEKNEATYRDIFRRHRIDPTKFLMIGNSLRSDVLPVLAAGGRALHLPYKHTWHHENIDEAAGASYRQPASMQAAVRMIMEARN